MSRNLVLSLLAVAMTMLVVAFGSDLFAKRGVQVTHWGDGSVRTRSEALRYPDGRLALDGAYEALFADGSRRLQGAYRQGKPHGIWSEWDAQGILRKRGAYRDGMEDGRWEYWNPGGTPEYEALDWQRGRVIENGEPVSPAPPGPPRYFGWDGQIVGYLLMLLYLLGPLPLALLAGSPRDVDASAADSVTPWLIVMTAWCLLQTGLALILAQSGILRAGPFFVAEAIFMIVGLGLCRHRGLSARAFAPRLEHPATLALFAAALVLGLAALEKGLAVPMTDWDGLAYHLPLMAEWVQNGSLVSVPELGYTGRYPSHWELMSLLGYFAFGEDLLFTLPNLIAWSMLGLSVIALARRAGAHSTDATATALLLLSLPIVLMQTEEIKADLPTAAAFGAALVVGGVFSDSRHALRPALFLLCLGWLCGLKASGPAYAGLALFIALVWRRAMVKDGFQLRGGALVRVFPALVGAALLGGFWYLRNFLELGNPLGDVQVQLLGKEIFEGQLQRADLQRTTFWSVWRPTDLADMRALFDAAREWLGWISIPLIACSLVAFFAGWRDRRARWTTATLILSIGISGGLYALTPFSGDNGSHGWRLTSWVGQTWRYALPMASVAAVLAARGWRELRLPRGVAVAIAVFAVAWSTTLHAAPPRASLVVAAISGVVLAAFLSPLRTWCLSRLVPAGSSSSYRIGLLALVLVFAFAGDIFWLHGLRELREGGRHELYSTPYTSSLEAATTGPVGFAMTQLRYPFYGRDLMRPVQDVSCRGCSRSAWLREFTDGKLRLLALGPEPVERSFARPEADLRPWVEAEGAPFRALQGVGSGAGEGIVLYEVFEDPPR